MYMEEKKPLFWPGYAHLGFGRYKKVLEDRRIASVVQRTRTSRKRKAPSFSRRGSLEDQFRKGPGPHFLLNLSIDRTTYQRVMFHISSTRSEEHTYELQSLMRNSYAVFCLKKKKTKPQ